MCWTNTNIKKNERNAPIRRADRLMDVSGVSGVSECQGEEERCVILPTHSEFKSKSSRVARGKKRREEGKGKGQSKAKQRETEKGVQVGIELGSKGVWIGWWGWTADDNCGKEQEKGIRRGTYTG